MEYFDVVDENRNLKFNDKYEYRRDFIQVKWYRLEEVIEKIIKKNIVSSLRENLNGFAFLFPS